ncbi:MAG: glycoside hydrolase family 13 protein [Clostridiales bacterium]|nr:glycoside hydrolase family 13 protein [Clostridiales bacterium]
MKIEHDSRSLLYRKPFGTVTCGTPVRLRLALTDFGIPSHIRVVCEFEGGRESVNMAYVFEVSGTYVYETTVNMPKETGLFHYYFDIGTHQDRVFYGNNADGLGGLGAVYDEEPESKYQITVYDKDFDTPKWWRTGVCYQIFPDRFYNGSEDGEFLGQREDIIRRDWGEEPFYKAEQFGGTYLANDFFGGNLLGIEKKLPYLKDLGISCIYLNPIFKAFSNHRYDTGDYKTIDPLLGTEEDFIRLCSAAEKLGMRIILDGVFNHTGSDSIYFNKNGSYDSVGAYQSKESPYYDWYTFTDYPDKYESWWGIDTLPQINEKSAGYRDYILDDKDAVVKKWLRCGASGWRLDVVDELPDFFVKLIRSRVKSENPNAVIIGEVWEDASNKVAYGERRRYFMGAELDSVMNYPLRNALVDFVNRDIDAEGFDKRIMSLKENYPAPAFYAAMNFLSGHDVERILTVMGGEDKSSKEEQSGARLSGENRLKAVEKLKCLITMQTLLPGVPTIFYGDEAGVEGYADPFCRACFPWGKEDKEIFEYYKRNIALRNGQDAFKNGEFETVYKVNGGYGFVRYTKNSSYAVLINAGEAEVFRLDAARFGMYHLCGVFHNESYSSDDGIYYIKMPEYSVKVFENIK